MAAAPLKGGKPPTHPKTPPGTPGAPNSLELGIKAGGTAPI